MNPDQSAAPGWPGTPPPWTSSAKMGVGTALSRSSHCWFTIAAGALTEAYYPHLDEAATRSLTMVLTDGKEYFSDEESDTHHEICYLQDGVPAYCLLNTSYDGRYRIYKTIFQDPERDVILQWTRFEPLQGDMSDYRLYALLTPHLGQEGSSATAWCDDFQGTPLLLARRGGQCLALACSAGWAKRSVGFAGASDGWQDLQRHKQMNWQYTRADNGHVALTGEVDLPGCRGECLLAIGFGPSDADAAEAVRGSLRDNLESIKSQYIRQWHSWQQTLIPLDAPAPGQLNLYRTSTMVIRTHESLHVPGGTIASLSIPWGFAKGDKETGYHVVWPRDLVEANGGLLAAGARQDVGRGFLYLQKTQLPDGHWAQNMWMNGTPLRRGLQLDECALPLLLADLARREEALEVADLEQYWPMIRRAAGYIVRTGPATEEDRWEHDGGYAPFTLATEVAALLAAAHIADLLHQPQVGNYLRQTADSWNACIEQWLYVTGTELAQRTGVEGYYVRIAPPEMIESAAPLPGDLGNFNRSLSHSGAEAASVVSPDALALVRFGLRDSHDARIRNTLKVIDTILKVDTPFGPCWRRYNGDKYGEHEDGSPFDGAGRGRAWPLLTGERAHYELAAGRRDEAERLLATMAAFANQGGMLPEQIWDAPDIPERGLFFGHHTGSAMPLVWAHAEFVKLLRSLHDGWVFDMPLQTAQRYLGKRPAPSHASWRFDRQCNLIPEGVTLRIEVMAPGVIHFSTDDWHTTHDIETWDTGLGIFAADVPTEKLASGSAVVFSLYWPAVKRWEGANFTVLIGPPPASTFQPSRAARVAETQSENIG